MNQYRPNGRMPYNRQGCGCSSNMSASNYNNTTTQYCHQNNNDCRDSNVHMRNMPLGMCYVPVQEWENLYSPCNSLKQGTAFPCLDLIFCGVRGNM